MRFSQIAQSRHPRVTATLRYLRIAFSAGCGVLCLLLIALWVRSFSRLDMVAVDRMDFVATSLRGCIVLYRSRTSGVNFSGHDSEPASIAQLGDDIPGTYFWFRLTTLPTDITLLTPMWFYLATIAGTAIVPWLRWRFSLRTLLIATTLVASGLAMIAWAA